MKIKRFQLVRPEVNIEFVKPILGRLYFLSILPKMIIVKKTKVCVGCCDTGKDFKAMETKTVFIIGIPKLTFRKAVQDA
jgi:hypothetical protein